MFGQRQTTTTTTTTMSTMTAETTTTINSHFGSRLAVLAQCEVPFAGFLRDVPHSSNSSCSARRTARRLLALRAAQLELFLLSASNGFVASCSTRRTARRLLAQCATLPVPCHSRRRGLMVDGSLSVSPQPSNIAQCRRDRTGLVETSPRRPA